MTRSKSRSRQSGLNLRVGHGWDSHRLVPGIPLMLGGVRVESELGAAGHSDGDCLLHALIDALLGALGRGDIGQWFPDSDARWRGADSRKFLEAVLRHPDLPDFRIVNVDMTVLLEKPKLGSSKAAISETLAGLLGVDTARVNLKAKTWEGIEPREPAIAAEVVLLLEIL